jgi:hypothetical protein
MDELDEESAKTKERKRRKREENTQVREWPGGSDAGGREEESSGKGK